MEERSSFARHYDLDEDRIIDVSSGVCPLGPSRKVRAAIRKAIRHINHEPDRGQQKLRKYFSSRYGFDSGSLCFGNSVRELLSRIIGVIRPRKVLLAGPALPEYEETARAAGAEIVYAHAEADNGFATDGIGIREQLPGTDLFVIANPNRVTGRLTGMDMLREVLSSAAGENTFVIVDESLMDFTGGAQSFWGAAGDNLVVLRTTAYFYGMPGLELAYAAAPPRIAAAVQKMQTASPGSLTVEAAIAAFKDGVYRKEAQAFVLRERAWLTKSLLRIGGISCNESDANIFLFRTGRPAEGVLHSLGRHGFFIKDCADIAGIDAAYFRCSLLGHEKAVKFLRLLKRGLQDVRVAD